MEAITMTEDEVQGGMPEKALSAQQQEVDDMLEEIQGEGDGDLSYTDTDEYSEPDY